jgi:hypothetical protein
MVQLRWALVGIVAMLAAAMKAPIWYLPAKVSAITGGDGWHRSYLMDVAFHDLASWWFVGMDIANTKEWFPYQVAATGAADITNQFIAFGLNAGVLAIALLVLVLVRAFGVVGQAMAVARTQAVGPSDVEYILWGLGCTMVVHVSTWLGITYNFDQTYCIWTLHLAALGSISQDLARGGGPLAGTSEKTSSRSAGKLLYRPRSRGRAAAA